MLFADDTGNHGPSVVTGWTNPQNTMVSDNVYTTGPSIGLTAMGYGFKDPIYFGVFYLHIYFNF